MTDWTQDLADEPQLGEDLPAPQLRPETLGYLAHRRSLTAAQMTEPGPSPAERDALLRIAARAPDHRRVHPFRFVLFEGAARAAFGDVLADAFSAANPDADGGAIAVERGRFERAPLVIAVAYTPNLTHKTPAWEQTLTAAAVTQNLVITAGAAGYAAQWLTEWYAYDRRVAEAMGLSPDERIVGFVYIGTATEAPKERPRLSAKELTSSWNPGPSQGS